LLVEVLSQVESPLISLLVRSAVGLVVGYCNATQYHFEHVTLERVK
jgi:hypothetical protein